MPISMAALPIIGGAFSSAPQSLADARYQCRAVTLPTRETLQLKLARVSQTTGRISAVNRPKFRILSGHMEEILSFNKFSLRLSIHTLVAKMQPDKIVRWCAYGKFLRHLCVPYFQRAACSTFQTCILNSH